MYWKVNAPKSVGEFRPQINTLHQFRGIFLTAQVSSDPLPSPIESAVKEKGEPEKVEGMRWRGLGQDVYSCTQTFTREKAIWKRAFVARHAWVSGTKAG